MLASFSAPSGKRYPDTRMSARATWGTRAVGVGGAKRGA
jgi:hypothetical protein